MKGGPCVEKLRAAVRVLDPERSVVAGANVVAYAVPVHGSRSAIGQGVTGTNGRWTFTGGSVPTEEAYRCDSAPRF